DGRIFVAGGQNAKDGVTTDATWFFDPGTGMFHPGPSMAGLNYAPAGKQVGVSDYSAFDLFPPAHRLRGRYLLIAGGEHDPLEGPDVELHSASIYDARQKKFFDVGPMPLVHDDHTESLLQINAAGNPELLLFGGNKTGGTSRFEFLSSSVSKE
ncbi:MAG TPA: kelch repeat-containing protein, partial [Planctomycetaceae bacterium]|nr:kelch repeat-containing protein [Planctomycetaceae bacterium]